MLFDGDPATSSGPSTNGPVGSVASGICSTSPKQMTADGIRRTAAGPGIQPIGTTVNLPAQYPTNQSQLDSSGIVFMKIFFFSSYEIVLT